MINGPESRGGKERQAFSVALVFEVKILWTGPENIFPRSQLKVHILPSQKWSFDQKGCLSLFGSRVWCWNCGFVLTTRWDSLQAPVSWTTTHTSNIQSDTNPWGKPCSVWQGKWSIHRTSRRQWRRVSRKRSLRAAWLLDEGKIKMIFKKKRSFSCFLPFFESGQESVSVS